MKKPLSVKILSIVLDCENAHELADFYASLLGWQKRDDNPEWIGVSAPNELPFLLFQQVEDYTPPIWPDTPNAQRQMVHIDFAVNDLSDAIEHAIHCGARLSPTQFSDHWKVMFDPAGHPFCFCKKEL